MKAISQSELIKLIRNEIREALAPLKHSLNEDVDYDINNTEEKLGDAQAAYRKAKEEENEDKTERERKNIRRLKKDLADLRMRKRRLRS